MKDKHIIYKIKRIVYLLIILSLVFNSCDFKRKRRNDNAGAIKIAVVKPEENEKYNLLESSLKEQLRDQNVEVSFYNGNKNSEFQTDALKSALNSQPDIMVIEGDELNILLKKISGKYKLPFIISTVILDTQLVKNLNNGITISSLPVSDYYTDFVAHIRQIKPLISNAGILLSTAKLNNSKISENLKEALEKNNVKVSENSFSNDTDLTKCLSDFLHKKVEIVILVGINNQLVKEVSSFFHQNGIITFTTQYQQVKTGGPAFGCDIDYSQLGNLTGQAVIQSLKVENRKQKSVIRPEKSLFFINSDAVLYQLKLQLADSIYEQSSVN